MQKNIYIIKFQLTALAFTLFTVLGVFCSTPAKVSAAPFVCEAAFYQSVVGQILRLNPNTGMYETFASGLPFNINSIGYNTEDNYIYGLSSPSIPSTLFRVDGDGIYTDLGTPAGLTSASVSGDFDHSGNLYALDIGDSTLLHRIDVSAMTSTTTTLSAAAFGNDQVYVNGKLYGTNGTSLSVIDVATGVVTSKSLGIPVATYGAGWATTGDQLYFSNNTSGVIYEILDYESANPSANAVLAGQAGLASNDGASCSLAPTVIIPVVAVSDTATTSANTPIVVSATDGLLKNDSPESATVSSNTQPEHGTASVQPDGSYTYTPNSGFVGQDTFTYTISDTIGNTSTATVTITVTDPGSSTVPEVPGIPIAGLINNLGNKSMVLVVSIVLICGIVLLYKRFNLHRKLKF